MDKGMLTDATSTDDSPTPGYLLNEIAHATVGSYSACTQLIDFLNARLKKNNHNVKFKCCHVIKHVCRNGRADFKKDMARNLDSLKDCLQYKGVPDPLRGDEIYRRVREAAKEALDAIFDSQQPVTAANPSVASRIQGISGGQGDEDAQRRSSATASTSSLSSFASSAKAMFGMDSGGSNYTGNHGSGGGDFSNSHSHSHAQSSSSGRSGDFNNQGSSNNNNNNSGSSTSSMAGIGNPHFQQESSSGPSLSSRVSAVASSMFSKKQSSNSSHDHTYHSNNSSGGDYQFRSNRPHNFGNNGQATGAWGPNGNNSNSSNNNNEKSGGGSGVSVNPNPIVPDLPSSVGGGRAGGASSSGEYEQGLVEALCSAGGMKAVPQEDKLASFLKTAPTLSAERVGAALLDCMAPEGSWQSRVKALIVLCRLMNTPSCEEHAVWWADNGEQDLLRLQSQDGKASVRSQAGKALQLIGLEGEVAAVMEHAQQQRQRSSSSGKKSKKSSQVQHLQQQQGNEVSLLDFGDSGVSQTPPAPQQQQSSSQAASSGGDDSGGLFSGLSLGSPSAQQQQAVRPTQQQPVSSVFDGMGGGGSQDILSFNDPLMNPAPSSQQQQQAPPTASSAISSLDFFSSDSPNNGSDITHHAHDEDPPSRSRQSSVDGSSFDFMGGSRGRASSTDRNSLTGFDFMGGGGSSGGSMGGNLTPQQQQQQQLFMQQQQQLMQMQQQQFYLQQQQHLQQHGGGMNPQMQQRQQSQQPMAGNINNVMGGLGMGRKHIPDPLGPQQQGGGFSFGGGHGQGQGGGRDQTRSRSGSSSQPGDVFSFVSDTVANKKATTNFSNKIT